MPANIRKSRTTVGQPTVSLLCSPCHKQGKITKLAEATAKFIDGVSYCTECWSPYGDRLVEMEPGSRRYTLR
jgi:hypothetical protein